MQITSGFLLWLAKTRRSFSKTFLDRTSLATFSSTNLCEISLCAFCLIVGLKLAISQNIAVPITLLCNAFIGHICCCFRCISVERIKKIKIVFANIIIKSSLTFNKEKILFIYTGVFNGQR